MKKRVSMFLVLILTLLWPFLPASSFGVGDQDLTAAPPAGYKPTPSEELDLILTTFENETSSLLKAMSLATAKALLIEDYYPWGLTSNGQVLREFGVEYDRANSSSLSQWDLSAYDFIMYASDQPSSYYQNIQANLGKISSFVSNGGLLIAHCCDGGWNYGDWAGLKILPSYPTHTNLYSQNVYIADASHPISCSLTDSILYHWNYSTHGYFNNLAANTKTIMVTDNARPTYIEYPYGNGKVLATMQTVEWGYGRIGRPQLQRNEMSYALEYCGTQRKIISQFSTFPQTIDPYVSGEAIAYTLGKQALITIEMLDSSGKVVRTIKTDRLQAAGGYTDDWYGVVDFPEMSSGSDKGIMFAPDGEYTIRLVAKDAGNPSIFDQKTAKVTVKTGW